MRTLTLCHERLARIQRVLRKAGGAVSVRDLQRTYSIYGWEVEQAAELGWVYIETRKPHTGRPSRMVRLSEGDLSKTLAAKLPPPRRLIPKGQSIRHQMFAIASVSLAHPGAFTLKPLARAYREAFPRARSLAGTYASASRLARNPEVYWMRQWIFAQASREVPANEPMPGSALEIWLRFQELGSWRAR